MTDTNNQDEATKRHDVLLRAIADSFETPHEESWTKRHNVSFDDMMAMTHEVAAILRGYVRADRNTQNLILMLGVTDGTMIDTEIAAWAMKMVQSGRKLEELTSQLRNANTAPEVNQEPDHATD